MLSKFCLYNSSSIVPCSLSSVFILGEAVDCYSNDRCDGSAIDTGVTPQECCLLPGSIAHQSGGGGEVCKICFSKHCVHSFNLLLYYRVLLMIRLLLHMVITSATCAWHACVYYKLHTWSHTYFTAYPCTL